MSFGNSKKTQRLNNELAQSSIFDGSNTIASRMKFNFSYFDFNQSNGPGQLLTTWSDSQRAYLYKQLVDFSRESSDYWKHQGRLVIYGNFPNKRKCDFKLPTYIPMEAEWGRFRLSGKVRLVGFMLSKEHQSNKDKDGFSYCTNTFYVVFLDKNHKFYKTEPKNT